METLKRKHPDQQKTTKQNIHGRYVVQPCYVGKNKTKLMEQNKTTKYCKYILIVGVGQGGIHRKYGGALINQKHNTCTQRT